MIAKSTQNLLTEINRFITESRQLLDSGALMELQGMDDQVRELCERVLELPDEERFAAAEPMQQLLEDLKDLGDAMVRQRDQLAGEISSLTTQKKAATAYKIADASDSYGKRNEEE